MKSTEIKLVNGRVKNINFIVDKLQVEFESQKKKLNEWVMRSARPDLVELIEAFLEHAQEKEHGRCTSARPDLVERIEDRKTSLKFCKIKLGTKPMSAMK